VRVPATTLKTICFLGRFSGIALFAQILIFTGFLIPTRAIVVLPPVPQILQFHRGPLNTMQSSTWESFSEASGITGSPLIPADAIRMTDWATNHGLLSHWTCAHILHSDI
jgi:hypothetical protein